MVFFLAPALVPVSRHQLARGSAMVPDGSDRFRQPNRRDLTRSTRGSTWFLNGSGRFRPAAAAKPQGLDSFKKSYVANW